MHSTLLEFKQSITEDIEEDSKTIKIDFTLTLVTDFH
ncbi:hypothetical protein MTR67_036070 [Solanum verrucosum]|uniref:Uncharacterized protein n=1 Tax=Solanum verrucosum TaxID=315347 RepID=A0AAF0UAW3_SOLVR|nr:hypothetical protein MTR67_036070 [Solanum verrucosum]